MDPSSAQHQDMSSHNSLENMLGGCSKPQQERKPRPQPEHAINCPRCDSTNTKFCYYNNYSLSQPRYFCKSCRRYWTKGGTLRNVPVGGGCRKNKRPSKRSQDDLLTTNPNQLPNLSQFTYDSNDLTLAFARLQKQPPTGHLGFDDRHLSIMNSTRCDLLGNSIPSSSCAATTPTPGFGNFLETPFNGNFHDFYYGSYVNGNNMGEVENADQQQLPYEDYMSSGAATTTAVTVTTMKQELSDNNHRGEGIDQNRVLWGFPWQLSGDGNMGIPEHHVDHSSGRESWINGLASSWHGLLNSPLM